MMGGIGQMIFGMIFNLALMLMFAPKPKDTISYGPRLDNLKPAVKDIQGQIINLSYGTTRISGTIFWCSDFRETVHEDVTEYSSKGGSDYTHTDVTYTYDCDMAVGICEGPIIGIRRIWVNKELIYNVDTVPNTVSWLKYKLFNGAETQKPSTTLQAHLGYGNVPAHRGLAYIVFEQFQLDPFGRRVPQSIEFEVVSKGVVTAQAYRYPQVNIANNEGNNWTSLNNSLPNSTNVIASILPIGYNRFVIPLFNNDNNNIYLKLDANTNNIVKYGANVRGITNYCYFEGSNVWGKSTSLATYCWHKVTFMGNKVKAVPCLILQGGHYSYSGTSRGNVAIINLINNRIVSVISTPNLFTAGSFNQYHHGPFYNNGFIAQQYFDGTGRWYTYDLSNIDTPINENIENIDEYGFNKSTNIHCLEFNSETTYSNPTQLLYTAAYEPKVFFYHFIGFPEDSSTYEDGNILGEYTTTTYSYSVVDVSMNITSSNGPYIKYEGYTYSIHDAFEYSTALSVKVNIIKTINTYKYIDNSLVSSTITNNSFWFPTMMGETVAFHDNDPDPPNPNPPYEKNLWLIEKKSVLVHYVEYEEYSQSTTNIGIHYWLKFKNGAEIISLSYSNGSSNIYRTYVKAPFSEYGDINFAEDGYITYTNYYSSSFNGRLVLPNRIYIDKDKLDPIYWGGDWEFDLNYTQIAHNYEQPFVKSSWLSALPSTSYWERGTTRIYFPSGTAIYYYDILENTVTQEYNGSVTLDNIIPFGGKDFIGTYFNNSNSHVYYLRASIDTNYALLGEIIEDITEKANIDLSVLDISNTAYNTKVFGFNISDDIKLIDALESLLMHYFIDAYESEWKIKYKTRKESREYPITVNTNELGVKFLTEDYNEKYKITVREDTQLPQSVSYTYISAENGFIQANVIAIRNIDFNLGIKSSIKCPMALMTNEAYNNAFRILFDMWRSTKEIEFRLPNTYSFIEPGDIVLLPIDTASSTNEYLVAKIFEVVAESHAFLELKAVEEDARLLDGFINDGAQEVFKNTMVPVVPSDGFVIDGPPLYNKYTNIDYNKSGVYFTVYGINSYWRGGSIFVSYDDVGYAEALKFGPVSAAYGNIVEATNYKVDPSYIDNINTITFEIASYQDFFSVSDDDYNYREGNVIALYYRQQTAVEFIQFKNVIRDPLNDKNITISGLTRGLYNSYNPANIISRNDSISLLPVGTGKFNIETSYFNSQVFYKLVSYGQSPDMIQSSPYVYKCKWYNPYNVANFKAISNGTDINLSWNSRERNKPNYLLNSPTQIDVKNYKLEIYDKDNILIRTVTDILTDNYTYTNANILLDNLTPNSAISFKLIRKATFLEFNHSVYDTTVNVPNNFTNNLLDLNTNLVFYLNGKESTSTTIFPTYAASGFTTVSYNNYFGLGQVPGDNGYKTIKSMIAKKNDLMTANTSIAYPSFTVAMLIKIGINGTPTYGSEYFFDGSTVDGSYDLAYIYNGQHQLICNIGQNAATINLDSYYLNKWLFVCMSFSNNISGKPLHRYIRCIENDTTLYNSYITSNVFGTNQISNDVYILKQTINNNDTLKLEAQDIIIYSSNLYVDANYSTTYITKLYNILKEVNR